MHNLAQEAREAIPETDRMGVRLQNPEDLLRRRLRERRRKPVDFRNTVLLHVYDLEGGKDVPTREESTIFHGDGDANCGGPWPRNKEAKWEIGVDRMFLEQAKFCEKRWRYDSVKKTDVENKLVEGKDLSGREERMKEKALAKREERLREEMKVEAKEEERLREEAEVGGEIMEIVYIS